MSLIAPSKVSGRPQGEPASGALVMAKPADLSEDCGPALRRQILVHKSTLEGSTATRSSRLRAILSLGASGGEGIEVVKSVWKGEIPQPANAESAVRRGAARVLLEQSPFDFLAAVRNLPLGSDTRLLSVAAMTRSPSKFAFEGIVESLTPHSEALMVAALQGVLDMRDRGRLPGAWTCARLEAVGTLVRIAGDTGIGSPQAPETSSLMFKGAASPHGSPIGVADSEQPAELRALLKSALAALSDGHDAALVACLRNSRGLAACAVPFEVLVERKSPELSNAAREILKDSTKDPAVYQLLKSCPRVIMEELAQEASGIIQGTLLHRLGEGCWKAIGWRPALLDPDRTPLGFGVLHRLFKELLGQRPTDSVAA